MLEEIFNLVKGAAQQSVIENPEIDNSHNDAVVAEATDTVASGLRNMVAGGGLQNIISLFNGNKDEQGSQSGILSNPIVNMMVGHFVGKLMNKFNMNSNQANQVANSLIPSVLSNLVQKTNSSDNNGFSLEGLLNSLTGGQATQQSQGGLNVQDIISQFTQGGQGGGGIADIISQFTQGAQQQQQKNGGGGLMDLIKGFMK